ncbi:hypothetical protein V6N12_056079 [Hibiscus sabdariffa]|uniref:Uncharacterized protein n=1 Tax=Hibiscus sabdariffa TaxID=183260 RepID=A0ABR2CRF8_9ROSI
MPNSDEIDTSVEAADVNVRSASTLEQSGSVALTSCPSALFGQTLTGNSQTGGVALPQGFNSSISPSSHSVVQYNRPMSSPLYTQLSTQYVAPLPQHPAMMQSSPTGAAQFHIATPEVMCK